MTKDQAETEYNLIKSDVNFHGWAMSRDTLADKYRRLDELSRVLGKQGQPDPENHAWLDEGR